MTYRTLLMVCMAAVLGLAMAPAAQAAIIYYDDFDGLRADPLDGTTPDTTPTGSETWSAHSSFSADGYGGDWWTGADKATLPFTPQSGWVYTLSGVALDADPDDVETYNADPVWVGFEGGPSVSIKDNSAGDVETSGPDGGVNEGGYGKGSIDVDIVLDTQPTLWEVEFFVDDVSVRGPEAYTANPTITGLEFGTFYMEGSLDSLTLDQVPEPATMALLGLGGLGMLIGRKRRR